MKLEKIWKTTKWNSRVTVSILSSCIVDAFACWERYFVENEESELGSKLKSFVAKVIDEIRPDLDSRRVDAAFDHSQCRLELIGKYVGKVGKNEGKCVLSRVGVQSVKKKMNTVLTTDGPLERHIAAGCTQQCFYVLPTKEIA